MEENIYFLCMYILWYIMSNNNICILCANIVIIVVVGFPVTLEKEVSQWNIE